MRYPKRSRIVFLIPLVTTFCLAASPSTADSAKPTPKPRISQNFAEMRLDPLPTKLFTQILEQTLRQDLGTPGPALLSRGGLDAGGGNSVGTGLFDDVENSDSQVLATEKVAALVEPLLKDLESKLPLFADQLRSGIDGLIWYLEGKPLSQSGPCLNQSSISIEQVVRACQSTIAVRIDRDFFNAHPRIQAPLVLHELLVYRQMRSTGVSDEALRETSRQIRNPEIGAEELKKIVRLAGFGVFPTIQEMKTLSLHQSLLTENCNNNAQRVHFTNDGWTSVKSYVEANYLRFLVNTGYSEEMSQKMVEAADSLVNCPDAPLSEHSLVMDLPVFGDTRKVAFCANDRYMAILKTTDRNGKGDGFLNPTETAYTILDSQTGRTIARGSIPTLEFDRHEVVDTVQKGPEYTFWYKVFGQKVLSLRNFSDDPKLNMTLVCK